MFLEQWDVSESSLQVIWESVPLMLAFTAIAALGMAPWQGDMGAVVASCSEYTYLTKHKHIDGTMYSCTSFGTKIGGGIGVALCGWLLM